MSKEAINDIGVRVAPTVHLGALIGWLALATSLRAGCALPFGLPSPPAEEPVITAQVRSSENGLQITVAGQRWSVGKEILINLRSPDRTLEGTFAATQPGADGQFTITFAYPSEPAWQALSSVVVIARSSDGQQQASTILLIPAISATPTATQTVTTTVALTAPVTPVPASVPA